MVYLFCGTDDYLKREGAKAVINRFIPEAERDFGLETIDAACETCDNVLHVIELAKEALYTASFFGGGKVIWLKDANFLPGATGRAIAAQAAKEAVSSFCEELQTADIPEGHHLIITSRTCSKSSRFYKWVATHGEFCECGSEIKTYQLEKVGLERLENLLPKQGLQMSPAVRRAFVQRTGADSWTLVSELEKLRTYIGGDASPKTVTLQDVETITSSVVGAEPFVLSNALLMRSPTQVTQAITLLRSDKSAVFPAAAAILNTLNDMCSLREAIDRRWLSNGHWELPSTQIPSRLHRLQGWMLSRQIEGVRHYTLNELRAARHYAIEMRFKLVDSTLQDPWDIIEPVLLRIVAKAPSRPSC